MIPNMAPRPSETIRYYAHNTSHTRNVTPLGGSVFIGFRITFPRANVFLASVYNEKTGAASEIRT